MALTKQDLINYFVAGCKTPDRCRVGTEFELLVYRQEGWQRLNYKDGILPIFQRLMAQDEWQPVYEANNIISLQKGDKAITLEPGGQFELSGGVHATLHQTKREFDDYLATLRKISQDMDIAFVPIGFEPLWSREDIDWMPKERYLIMREYMPTKGALGLDMMLRTCTVQVNLDYSSEQDMVRKMRVAMALQPLVTALFASSPFREGAITGFQSYRARVWQDTDPDRCGLLPFVFDDSMGFERYVDYLLTVPMYFSYRNGRYINRAGQLFSEQSPETVLQDWTDHTTVAFPEVRLKNFLEMRGADVGSPEMLIALPAFWVGLLYEQAVLEQVLQYVSEWSVEGIANLHKSVPHQGLEASISGRSLWAVANDILQFAYQGLALRGLGEGIYLKALLEIVETQQTAATRMLHAYNTRWQGDVRKLFLENKL